MILVTGANGFVGAKIMKMCNETVASPSLRNASYDEILRLVEENRFDAIIHTAAISDIGTCETNPDASYIANVQLPVYLAKAAAASGQSMKLIYFSSDQVYSACDDDGPYSEENTSPGNLYAKHKLEMEQRVLDIDPNAVMLRAEWMYDYYLIKSNYFMNILRAKESVSFSSREYRGITYVKEVAQNMEAVLHLPGGSYNFGSETTKSMNEITKEFAEFIGHNLRIEEKPASRNLWMNCEKARKYGVRFSSVEDGLKICAKDYMSIINRMNQ